MRTRPHLDREQYDELTDILQAAEDNSGRLSPWEVEFIDSVTNQIDQWGQRATVSEKQWEILKRIQRKIG